MLPSFLPSLPWTLRENSAVSYPGTYASLQPGPSSRLYPLLQRNNPNPIPCEQLHAVSFAGSPCRAFSGIVAYFLKQHIYAFLRSTQQQQQQRHGRVMLCMGYTAPPVRSAPLCVRNQQSAMSFVRSLLFVERERVSARRWLAWMDLGLELEFGLGLGLGWVYYALDDTFHEGSCPKVLLPTSWNNPLFASFFILLLFVSFLFSLFSFLFSLFSFLFSSSSSSSINQEGRKQRTIALRREPASQPAKDWHSSHSWVNTRV